eukprot:CAMPEP_0174334946 /NCGR_PEP_ID=MMETSP0810-20121108/20337_1 /TAXON_ID=73025 ORGANISM="Eutreptiella gymnastica-like, Strain CCMP1594" /NCGR_SAMPLE_ID=MMETSP0810 /ASSEMBLY_ACC=CAM_ASM_000659 /LENGTH=463 /DNA_ID=CAMNT_0015452925 /DNA_START=187 /DNA_END=1575 /DNA_ORIENTATION=-
MWAKQQEGSPDDHVRPKENCSPAGARNAPNRTFQKRERDMDQRREDKPPKRQVPNEDARKPDLKCLYVGNLPSHVGEEDILDYFRRWRPRGARMKNDFDGHGRYQRGYCFVEFDSREDASEAYFHSVYSQFGGRNLVVRFNDSSRENEVAHLRSIIAMLRRYREQTGDRGQEEKVIIAERRIRELTVEPSNTGWNESYNIGRALGAISRSDRRDLRYQNNELMDAGATAHRDGSVFAADGSLNDPSAHRFVRPEPYQRPPNGRSLSPGGPVQHQPLNSHRRTTLDDQRFAKPDPYQPPRGRSLSPGGPVQQQPSRQHPPSASRVGTPDYAQYPYSERPAHRATARTAHQPPIVEHPNGLHFPSPPPVDMDRLGAASSSHPQAVLASRAQAHNHDILRSGRGYDDAPGHPLPGHMAPAMHGASWLPNTARDPADHARNFANGHHGSSALHPSDLATLLPEVSSE